MALESTQSSYTVTKTIGETPPLAGIFGINTTTVSGSSTVEIDYEKWYQIRSKLRNGFRPYVMETYTITDVDDMGNNVTETYETIKRDNDGNPVKYKYIQCDDGHDEKYFFHLWDWAAMGDINASTRQVTVTRAVKGIKKTVTESSESTTDQQTGQTTVTSTSTDIVYVTVSSNVSMTLTLDKVDMELSGTLPNNIYLYYGGTDDNKIFFKYTTDTANVLKVGDTINGATITKIWNPFLGGGTNVIDSDTVCYAEISGGSSFSADTTYTSNGISVIVVSGKGIRTRSAAVGTFIRRDAKDIELSPVFYKNETNQFCQQETTSDSNADYFKGSVILEDGTYLFDKEYIIKKPKTTETKMLYNVLMSNFSYSPKKSQVEEWLSLGLTLQNLRNKALEDIRAYLNEKTVASVIDNCYNQVLGLRSVAYDPYYEINAGILRTQSLSSISEECITPTISGQSTSTNPYGTIEAFTNHMRDIINNNTSETGTILSEQLYNQLIGNEDSMMNKLDQAMETIEDTFSDMSVVTMENNIHAAEAENESTTNLNRNSWRDVPQSFPKVDMVAKNIDIDDTKLDIVNSANIITTTLKSIPKFTGPDTIEDTNFNITVNKSGGYVTKIIAERKLVTPAGSFLNPITGLPLTPAVYSVDIGPGGTAIGQGAQPHTIWDTTWTSGSEGHTIQIPYEKDYRFRTEEISEFTKNYSINRGNPILTPPVYARLSSNLGSSDTTINVESTSGFLSSGYLIIPKFIKKLEYYTSNNNIRSHYFYDGEEIIYYSGKTSTSFTGCIRGRYGTNSSFVTSLTPYTRSPENSVTTSYYRGECISQYHPYKIE